MSEIKNTDSLYEHLDSTKLKGLSGVYEIENTKDSQEYVIDDNDKYIILIKKDNYVFYGKGNLEYKEELDYIVKNIIDVYMK